MCSENEIQMPLSEELDRLIIQYESSKGARNPGLQLLHYKRPGADGAWQVAGELLRRLNLIQQWWEDNDPENAVHWIAAGGSSCAKNCPCCKVEACFDWEDSNV